MAVKSSRVGSSIPWDMEELPWRRLFRCARIGRSRRGMNQILQLGSLTVLGRELAHPEKINV
jgi:hypothetical protein